jgi:tripartite-type tricarboxylate transporter receptor subunit TctC
MKEAAGKDISYLMLRGIFMAPGVKQEEIDFYVNTMKKVTETPEWKKYTEDMGLKPAYISGPEFVKWLEEKEKNTKDLMASGKLLK